MNPLDTLGLQELALRLAIATIVGGILGLNRELRGKPAGFRTYAIITLGAAAITLASLQPSEHGAAPEPSLLGRVVQGILTGIGFLGAGVILRDEAGNVRGLTTAAMVFVTAILGILCGLGHWLVVAITTSLVLLVLLCGRAIERMAERLFGEAKEHDPAKQ